MLANLGRYMRIARPQCISVTASMATSSPAMSKKDMVQHAQQEKFITVDAFARRQWDASFAGTVIDEATCGLSPEGLAKAVHDLVAQGNVDLVDGYAPFCKHLFIPNITGSMARVLPLQPVAHLVKYVDAGLDRSRDLVICRVPSRLRIAWSSSSVCIL